MKIGLDIGSTTIKCVVLDEQEQILYSSYERHFSHIVEKAVELLSRLDSEVVHGRPVLLSISGSAGMGFATKCGIPFVQEVFATRVAANRFLPGTDVIIELGGEDAKIIFLDGGMEVRMNGSCAGGTGAFIDQMSTLLGMSLEELNEAAKKHEKIYTIASRCGVFAKTDIQPLLNQGAKKEDIAASIFYAVVNQTIGGLAQGRAIEGNVVYLGGPISFLSELKNAFDWSLGLQGTLPENSLYFVALGAALYSDKEDTLESVIAKLNAYDGSGDFAYNEPLFKNKQEYDEFCARHAKATVPYKQLNEQTGPVHIGIDAGSTTVKTAVIDSEGSLLLSSYQKAGGNPVPIIRDYLLGLYEKYPYIQIASVTSTGYGEEIIKNAFQGDFGVVETVAHFTAARRFMPEVDFVIDIGGQDMKCFQVEDGVITNIFLNEACSSGCGSFLQTFAEALGYSIEDFANLGLFADRPVELGSRCTVFMNSSVKQAQKDGASIENISAGLSISVVKNALYKVIRASNPTSLGRHIVVQGGTFLNKAVLRAFEKELQCDVVAPAIAGLMGAYGAALYGMGKKKQHSTVLDAAQLKDFTHEVKNINCGLCSNNCQLTVNTFSGGRKFISGNRCERPIAGKRSDGKLNIYRFKQELLEQYKKRGQVDNPRAVIGVPMGLNMYELLPFWIVFFTELGFSLVTSPRSSRELYLKGQGTIPSDTVCFPAKLIHGHIAALLDRGVDAIFYPCMSYNIDEDMGDNHYNCPVVAYYPEVIAANDRRLADKTFIYDYIGIHRKHDFPKKMTAILQKYFDGIGLKEVKHAAKKAYEEYDRYLAAVKEKGQEIIEEARREGRQIIVLCGRPYHLDEEINHGIDLLIAGFGAAVISEDAVSHLMPKMPTTVLNQWTYHARLYSAANYVTTQDDMNLVQLVSFGCGVDAITTDEVRSILEAGDKIYTQIKIDEITNLGAVKIRLRSLFAAIEEKQEAKAVHE